MAYENINITTPIFCVGPQIGTFCYITTNNSISRLVLINSAGSFLRDFVLSSNLLYPLISVEYVGPKNLTALYKGLTFFTLEHIFGGSDIVKFDGAPSGPYQALVKRWELDPYYNILNLKQSFVLHNVNAWGMAVEHYNESLSENCPGNVFFVEISNTSRIVPGMHMMLGPSSDIDNRGAVENLVVSYVSGNRVYFTSRIVYQYVAGDKLSFYKNFYVVSRDSKNFGSLLKYNAETGALVEFESNKGYYASVLNIRWAQAMDAIALIYRNNMIFKRPYDYYLNWKSINLNNELNGFSCIVYDVAFSNTDIFKLMRSAVYKNDSGERALYSWSTYNYQLDTLLPYTNSVSVYSRKSTLIGHSQNTVLFVKVTDQFGVSLRDVNVNFYIESGDFGAVFDPLFAQITTDINGEGEITYFNSGGHHGVTKIRIKADGSSSYTGSQYVWNAIFITTHLNHSNKLSSYAVSNVKNNFLYLSSRSSIFKTLQFNRSFDRMEVLLPQLYIDTRTYFTTPGGEKVGSSYSTPGSPSPRSIWFYTNVGKYSAEYWPQLQITGGRGDGPPTGASWEGLWFGGYSIKAHYITQIASFVSDSKCISVSDLISNISLRQKNLLFGMMFSQLKLSKHSHFVDGFHYFDLLTTKTLNQFVFVEDAIPKFWSEKNAIETYIWIRVRPFGFNLNNSTFRFWVREVWSEGNSVFDTGYNDVTSAGVISNFSAGGGLLGIEFRYQPPHNFHYDALVFIHLEVYDTAYAPNFIYLDYWFRCIPDYKSPYLVNLKPGREEQFVPVDTDIYFEIKDDGAGVDIDSLEVFLNSISLSPTEIVKINGNYYSVKCALPNNLLYDKSYFVNVVVADKSPSRNYLRDSYRFYTHESAKPIFIDFDPKLCLRGMGRFYDVSFTVLADHLGVDKNSIRLQVAHKDVTDELKLTPIIYRVS